MKTVQFGIFHAEHIGVFAVACTFCFACLAYADEVTYLHADALGSPIAATDENGTLLWEERYEPFGERFYEPSAAAGNRRSFTGHAEDGNGLVYMGARYYNPEIGRFYSVDSAPIDANHGYSAHLYVYAVNNPIAYLDPDGRDITLYVRDAGDGWTNFGHVALRVYGKGYDKTFDFGRYGKTWGFLKSKGEGILRVWKKSGAFVATQRGEGELLTLNFDTSTKFDKAVLAYYQSQIDRGEKAKTTNQYESFKLKDNYDLLDNNCTTKTMGAIRAGEGATGQQLQQIDSSLNENAPSDLFQQLQPPPKPMGN